MMKKQTHEFGAFVPENARILILGSFPSVKSRETGFYYGHPQNRFWKVMAWCAQDAVPVTIEEKKAFLCRHQIALWDVIESCEIHGSSDASIKNAVPVNIEKLLQETKIERILLNGKTAEKLYHKYNANIPIPAYALPSTSPANAAFSLEKLCEAYLKVWIVATEDFQC